MPTNFQPKDGANPYADYDAAKMAAFLARYELPRDPGTSYEYSNLGFGLLGHALGQYSQLPYGMLVERDILRPLGMTMSSTRFTNKMFTHLAPGQSEDGKPAENWDLDAMAGAGALRSTAHDMLRYLKANMGVRPCPLYDAMKFGHQPRNEMSPSTRIGLAWLTTKDEVIWHNGGTGGYRSFLGFSADGRRGVVILTNTAVSVDDLGFATLLPHTHLVPVQRAINPPVEELHAYLGAYELSAAMLLNISLRGDCLYAQATGQGAFALYCSAADEFFAKVAAISISFERDHDGAVSSLVLHQSCDYSARKL